MGVRELKNQATEILRTVRENRSEYISTYHGRPVAVLLPIDDEWLAAEDRRAADAAVPGEDLWAELSALRRAIGDHWQSEKTGVEIVAEQRR